MCAAYRVQHTWHELGSVAAESDPFHNAMLQPFAAGNKI
jgi:hypothetical protein